MTSDPCSVIALGCVLEFRVLLPAASVDFDVFILCPSPVEYPCVTGARLWVP